ncbi:hypothetical protein [Amphritea sp.]|uniref:hypothetical protein n=1 Tax=Amphritea sp. TaxID=1872502 RepID=UPI0025C68E70|nr:hypothetical protein [Amphritea sp.]
MDKKHIFELLGNFIKSICDNWFVIVFFFGVLALFLGHILPLFSYKEESVTLGNVIIFSSVFASFTRWISVRGIIKKTLNEILSSKEHLANNKNFDNVWKTLVEVAIEKHNPHLTNFLENSSVRSYIPQEGELFYSSYTQHLDIEWSNEEERLVKIIETTKVTVKTKDNSLHKMPYNFVASMPIGKRWTYSIESLKVGKNCCLSQVKVEGYSTNNEAREDQFKTNYELELEGNTEYHIHRIMHREICLDYEPYIIVVSGKHTWMPEISCSTNKTGVKGAFNSTGTLEEFDTIAGRNNSNEFCERHPGLMLKGQGYILCLSK